MLATMLVVGSASYLNCGSMGLQVQWKVWATIAHFAKGQSACEKEMGA